MFVHARLTVSLTAFAAFLILIQAARAQNDAWQVHRNTDAMSDQVTSSASRTFTFDRSLRVRATASCASGIVNFAFEVFGAGGDGMDLAWQESDTYSGTTFGFSTQLSRDVHRWVPLRVRVGEGPVLQRNSSSKFSNEAEIVFYDPREVQAAADAQKRNMQAGPGDRRRPASPAEAFNDLGEIFGAMATASLPMLMPMVAAGTFNDLRAVQAFRVELPLADGRAPVVVIAPAAPGLQAFLTGCGGQAATAAFEGVFDGPGMKLIFRNGALVMQRGNEQAPPLPFRRSGNQILVTDTDRVTHAFNITPDGDLLMARGESAMRFARER